MTFVIENLQQNPNLWSNLPHIKALDAVGSINFLPIR